MSKLTEDKISKILESISGGNSLRASLLKEGICNSVWYEALKQPNISERYARAREYCAHSHADLIMDTVRDVLQGNVDPNAARVAIDGAKWTASKLHFRDYGDKQSQEHSGAVTVAINTNCKVSDG